MKPPSLFPDCVLPGCRAPVAHSGDACPGCCTAFGEYLQVSADRPALTADLIAERDAHVLATYTARHAPSPPAAGEGREEGAERKPNQRCWLCDESRTCTRRPGGWECDQCRRIGE